MKKFYSLLALSMMTVAANAAVQVTYNGTPIAEGQEILLGKNDFKETDGPAISGMSHYIIGIDAVVTGDTPIKLEAFTDNKDKMQICAVGGTCWTFVNPSGDYYALPVQSLTSSPTTLEIDAKYLMVKEIPDVNCFTTVTLTDNSGSKVSFTIKMDSSVAGIDKVEADEATITVNGKSIDYNVAAPTQLAVYSIAGNTVINQQVNGHGSVSLAGLHSGLYIYRVGRQTGKIVIR